jgi:hypothetical protein
MLTYDAVPRRAMLEGFDPYANAGKIAMPFVYKHFMVRRPVQGKERLEDQA